MGIPSAFNSLARLLFIVIGMQVFSTHLCTAYEGCTIRYGRRGCLNRILTGVVVLCDGQGTEESVPQNIPQDSIYVSLINFKLGRLTKSDFIRFSAVECLTITGSQVAGIDWDAFSGMETLHELVLSETQLTSADLAFVSHPTFAAELLQVSDSPNIGNLSLTATTTLHQLKTLELAGNNLETISPALLPELRHVEKFDLSRNNLRSLDWEGLHEMSHLNQLLLASNQFQSLPQYIHTVFFAVKELKLGNNPLHCNCKLSWLWEFYQRSTDKNLDVDEVVCVSPKVISMSDAPASDFQCSQPTPPVILWSPLPNNRFEVNCTSVSDPAPTLTFSFPNGRIVITPPSNDLAQLKTITPQIISGGGPITCRASNSEGEAETTHMLPVDADALNGSPHTFPSILYVALMTSLAVVSHVCICQMHR